MAARLVDSKQLPHILIEGRPDLTKRLWERCGRKPIVLTSRVISSPVYQATRGAEGQPAPAEPAIFAFSGTALLPGMEIRYPEMAHEARAGLAAAVEIARERFALASDEKVRIVVAGSQGSLWLNEHANVAMPGWQYPEAPDSGEEELFALKCLGLAAQNRQFVHHLHAALSAIDGVELMWLAHAFPELCVGLEPEQADYPLIAAQARHRLATHENFRNIGGAIPLLYTRRNGGQWIEFTERWPAQPKLSERGQNPYRSTGQLIQQYLEYPDKNGLECVLVKVLPPGRADVVQNPCDNPIITTSECDQARDASISAILIDKSFGTADLVVEGREHFEAFVAWQRAEIAKAIAGTQPLVETLKQLRGAPLDANAASTFFAGLIHELDTLGKRVAAVRKRNPTASVDVSGSNPFAQLYKTFLPFRRTPVSPGPRHDPAGTELVAAPRPVEIHQLTDDELYQAISDTVAHIADVLDQGSLKPPINALAAFRLIDGLNRDLISLLGCCNELQTRIEEARDLALHGSSHSGIFGRIWRAILRRFRRIRRFLAGDAANAMALLRIVEMHAGLLRTLEAAAEDLHGQLGAHPDRGDNPPIFRV